MGKGTNFPNGLLSYGVPVLPNLQINPFGRVWFVDAKSGIGSDGFSGRRPDRPFLTMAKALANVDSGDTVIFRGKVREQLVAPVGVFDVSIIGAANRPRHADDHSESSSPGRGSSAATWAAPASPTATTALLRVLQQGWRVANVLFACPTDYAAVEIVRNAGADDAERDGSHAEILGCRFASGQNGIQSGKAGSFTEIVHNVLIQGCTFNDQTADAITGINGRRFQILDNVFQDVESAIDIAATQFLVKGNVIGKHTTIGIDLGGGDGYNMVTANQLSGPYTSDTGIYIAGANDDWSGNFSSDEDEATVTSGVTHAVPTTD